MSIVATDSIASFFDEVVEDALEGPPSRRLRNRHTVPRRRAGRAAHRAVGRPLALSLQEALVTSEPAERFSGSGSSATPCSTRAGFFADHFAARGLESRYVATIGSRAYVSAGAMLGGATLFDELARRFEEFSQVLSEVADRTLAQQNGRDPRGLLKLYERWLKTGSETMAEALVEHGLFPTRGVRGAVGRAGGRRPSAVTTSDSLRGFGVDIVREREVACSVQASIERFYDLERVADVGHFVTKSEGRERLYVRDAGDVVEMVLELPRLGQGIDGLCQIIEGVSHFVYVATRASQDRASTALELEVQAEVDKYVVLAGDVASLDVDKSAALRARLYENVEYADAEDSELGERYRVANRTALRFLRRLELAYVAERRFGDWRRELNEFFRSGQEEKLRRAA